MTVKGLLTDLYLGYPSSVHITSIWYLISLCGITVVYFILYAWSQKIGKKFVLYLGLALSGAAGYCIYIVKGLAGVGDNTAEAASAISLPGGRLPLTVDASLMALIFFAIGVWCCQRDMLSRLKNKGTLAAAGLVMTVVVGCFFNTRVNIHGCSYGNIVYFFVAAMSGTIMVICVAQTIGTGTGKLVTGLKRTFIFFGKNSLFMFAMQSLFVHLYVYVINKCTGREYVLYENVPFLYGMMGFLLITVLCLPISYWVVWKCKKFVVRKNG